MGFILPTHIFANIIWFILKYKKLYGIHFKFLSRDFIGTKWYNISNIKTKINKTKFKSATEKIKNKKKTFIFYNI